jgi:phosphorylcholine metabolism protein LicD
MPPCHRTAFSKFRCGVAPLRVETGRYEGLDILERKCQFSDSIEDESHVFLDCFVYDDLRQSLFEKAKTVENAFVQMSKNEQLIFLFSKTEMIRYCAKTCLNILQRRLLFSFK